jgi:hypothetical protein
VGPQSRRLMRDAIHRERVEPDFFLHGEMTFKGAFARALWPARF